MIQTSKFSQIYCNSKTIWFIKKICIPILKVKTILHSKFHGYQSFNTLEGLSIEID